MARAVVVLDVSRAMGKDLDVATKTLLSNQPIGTQTKTRLVLMGSRGEIEELLGSSNFDIIFIRLVVLVFFAGTNAKTFSQCSASIISYGSLCADTKHQMGLSGYENVCVVKTSGSGSISLEQAYSNLTVQEDECNFASGLIVALDMLLQKEGKGTQDKHLHFVSNGKSNVDPEDQALIDRCALTMEAKEIQLTVL